MKVVHVLKRIELIDEDVKELRKLEKSIRTDKSFSSPIIMSIENQINILLGQRIKYLELRIENPPANLVEEIEGKLEEKKKERKRAPSPPSFNSGIKARKKRKSNKNDDDDEIRILTQDMIDKKVSNLKADKAKKKKSGTKASAAPKKKAAENNDDNVKLLDLALEKGNLDSQEEEDKDKKVKFFRENFPMD
ncbi:hypothetical protein ACFL20_04325 [Spirochaetota bacterium]